jgi:hypothetical protein
MVQVTEDKRPSSFEMIAAAINRVVEQAPRAQRLVPRFIDRGDGHLHRSLGARPITASRTSHENQSPNIFPIRSRVQPIKA